MFGELAGVVMRAKQHPARLRRQAQALQLPPPQQVSRNRHRWGVWQVFTIVVTFASRLLPDRKWAEEDVVYRETIASTTRTASNRRRSAGTSLRHPTCLTGCWSIQSW